MPVTDARAAVRGVGLLVYAVIATALLATTATAQTLPLVTRAHFNAVAALADYNTALAMWLRGTGRVR
jgi:hypothetical protein